MTSGFLNPSQSDFVIFKQNPIKLWYTARRHSGLWAGFSIVCSFSRSLCHSCNECINLPAILPISDGKNCKHIETSTARDWAYGCASFYSWLTRKRLLAFYIDCRNKGPIVPCLMVWIFVCIPSGGEEVQPHECAKKVMSDDPGIVNLAIGLVNSVLGKLSFWGNSNYRTVINLFIKKIFRVSLNGSWASTCQLQLPQMASFPLCELNWVFPRILPGL